MGARDQASMRPGSVSVAPATSLADTRLTVGTARAAAASLSCSACVWRLAMPTITTAAATAAAITETTSGRREEVLVGMGGNSGWWKAGVRGEPLAAPVDE